MGNDDKILKLIINVVKDTAPNSEVYLYGSHARSDSNDQSDWDILILLDGQRVSFKTEVTFMDKFYELELETGEVFSPLIYSKSIWNTSYRNSYFYDNIKAEGVKLQ